MSKVQDGNYWKERGRHLFNNGRKQANDEEERKGSSNVTVVPGKKFIETNGLSPSCNFSTYEHFWLKGSVLLVWTMYIRLLLIASCEMLLV